MLYRMWLCVYVWFWLDVVEPLRPALYSVRFFARHWRNIGWWIDTYGTWVEDNGYEYDVRLGPLFKTGDDVHGLYTYGIRLPLCKLEWSNEWWENGYKGEIYHLHIRPSSSMLRIQWALRSRAKREMR